MSSGAVHGPFTTWRWVAAVRAATAAYPAAPPYHPDHAYREYAFGESATSAEPNAAYAAVREAFSLLGLDAPRFGTAAWNPLGDLLQPGHRVVLKPNFVRHFADPGGDLEALVTHGSVIRAVADYAFLALQGRGEVVVADAPNNDGDFATIARMVHLLEIVAFYKDHGLRLEPVDIHREWVVKTEGIISHVYHVPGDPRGYRVVNLAQDSEFARIPWAYGRLRGADYDMDATTLHHNERVNEYLISGSVMDADLIINLPKFKTHKKAGVTMSLKNLVGINGDKNWLPHHREGVPVEGGDQYADSDGKRRLEQRLVAQFKRTLARADVPANVATVSLKRLGRRVFGDTNGGTIRSGNWHGNDTTWRMVLDLNRAALYADAAGDLHTTPQRHYLTVLDGIVGGDRNGPMQPRRREVGLVAASLNPVALDVAGARLMGFDWRKLAQLTEACRDHPYPLARFSGDDVEVLSNETAWRGRVGELRGPLLAFEPHFGWKGRLELFDPSDAGAREAG